MDDKTIFNNTNQANNNQSSDNKQNKPLSIKDLYGTSSASQINQNPLTTQSSSEPVVKQNVAVSTPPQQVENQASQTVEQPSMDIVQPVTNQQMPQGAYPPPDPFKNKKKKYLLIGVVILIVIIFVIGLLSIFFKSKTSDQPYANATLVYWGLWEKPETMRGIINNFQKEYPTIKIDYKQQDSKQYKERLRQRTENNLGPDIFTYHNSWLPQLTDMLLPLPNDVITQDEYKKIYFPVVQNDLIKNGAIYGIPQGIDSLALFINTDIFDAAGLPAPQNWDDVIKAAKTIAVPDTENEGNIKTAGVALGTYKNINHASDIISLLFVQSGVDFNNPGNSKENMKQALQSFYIPFATGKDAVWNDSFVPSRNAFASGQLAMYFGYSWDIYAIKSIGKNNNLKFEVYPVPNVYGQKQSIVSYWVSGVSQKSKYQREALAFMRYLTRKDVVQKLYSDSSKAHLFGMPYARKDLADSLKDNQLIYPFVQQAEYDGASSTYFSSDTNDETYSDALNQNLGNAIESMRNNVSADTALDQLINNVNQIRSANKL